MEEGFEDIRSFGVVFSGEVITALISYESVTVILVFGDPCLKCRRKVVERGVAEENLLDAWRDLV